ncbi:MAG: hypothetical protein EXS00_07335 [Phycisphaerales bacterium]|nr:hypothetical protein [Phycisphaerales bacterium]
MTSALRRLLTAGDRFQCSRSGKISFGIIALVCVAAISLPAIRTSLRYSDALSAVERQLAAFDDQARSPEAVQLIETGTMSIGGRTLGGDRIKVIMPDVVGEDGRILYLKELAAFVLLPEAPDWLPATLAKRPQLCIGMAVLLANFLVLAVVLECSLLTVGALGAGALVALPLLASGAIGGATSAMGIGALILVFAVLSKATLVAIGQRRVIPAIAHTVIKEAMRLRISTLFIGIVLVSLPLIPLWIDPASPLRYQIQTFIARATGIAFGCAACMTILLACATTSFEMRDRQIWQLLTKPVSRLNYLVGKWLGVVLVDAILLAVAALAIVGYTEFLRTRDSVDLRDAQAVTNEVLVARQAVRPTFEEPTREFLMDAVDRTIAEDSTLQQDIADGLKEDRTVRGKLAAEEYKEFLARQRAVDPGSSRTFRFEGIGDTVSEVTAASETLDITGFFRYLFSSAAYEGQPLSLRFFLHTGASSSHETHPVIFLFPKTGMWIDRMYVPAQGHEIQLPHSLIEPDGSLRLEVQNVGFDGQNHYPGASTIFFDADGLEILYAAGTFEGNFFRAMVIDLAKLSFIAMLGVCAGSVLSFPVSCLVAFTLFLVALLSPFLAISLEYYWAPQGSGIIVRALHGVVKGVAFASQWMLGAFGNTRASDRLTEGRLITWEDVGRAVGLIGFGWSLLVLAVGYSVLRRKEIAIYSGQG